MKTVRVGLVGCGFMGKTHLYAIRNLPFFFASQNAPAGIGCRAEVVAICSSAPERAARMAEEFGIGRVHATPEALIADPDIDVVDICSPNPTHYGIAKAAMLAGKHVLCEKPLTVSVLEAEELVRLSRETGLTCGMVLNNRYLSPILRAKALVDEGALGRILSFDFAYRHNSCIDPERRAGWKQNADFGGGTLADLGPHIIDLCHHLCGELQRVIGRGQIAFPTHRSPSGEIWLTNADEAFYILAETTGGARGTITVSKLTQGANDELTFSIWGERGAISFSLMDPNYLYYYDATASGSPLGGVRGYTRIECVGRYPQPAMSFPTVKAPQGWLRGHTGALAHYLSAVAKGEQASPSFEDGLYVERVLAAAYQSQASGEEVTLC